MSNLPEMVSGSTSLRRQERRLSCRSCGLCLGLGIVLWSLAAFGQETQSRGRVVFDAWTLTSGKTDEILQFTAAEKIGYELELGFLTPGTYQIGQIVAGGQLLATKVPVASTRGDGPIPPARRWKIPPAAIGDGRIEVQLQKIRNTTFMRKNDTPEPFAVHIRIHASDPRAKSLAAALPSRIEPPVVRLSLHGPRWSVA